MAMIEVQRFNITTRTPEPILINSDFIVKVLQRDTALGVVCGILIDDEWMLVSHSLQDIYNRIAVAVDKDFVPELDLAELANRSKRFQW